MAGWHSRIKKTSNGQRVRVEEPLFGPVHAARPRQPRLSTALPNLLHKAFLNASHPPIDEPLTNRIRRKYNNLIKRFNQFFPDLKKYSELEKPSEIDTTHYVREFMKRFKQMMEFCKTNDKWALKSANNITAPTAMKRFFEYASAPIGGDKPLSMSREEQVAELEKLTGSERLSDL